MAAPRQPDPPHGSRARYNAFREELRCRCDKCRAANATYSRRYRRATGIGRVDAGGQRAAGITPASARTPDEPCLPGHEPWAGA